jgi:hypothetical protein
MVRLSSVQKANRAKAITTTRQLMRGVRTATTASSNPVKKATGTEIRRAMRKAKIRI